MRIETPTGVNVDHPTYYSLSLSVETVHGPDLLGATPAMTVRALGTNPTLLLQLERLMAATRFTGDWTARLWSVSPIPRFGGASTFIVGWREGDDDRRMDAQLQVWTRQVGRSLDAVHVTWVCLHVPTVNRLVDLRSPDAPPYTLISRTGMRIGTDLLIIHNYRQGNAPAIRAAYDSETHTLSCLT